MHWPPFDPHQVLQRDRHPVERVERGQRRRAVAPRSSQAGVGGVGGRERRAAVDREPGVQDVVLPLCHVERGRRRLAGRDLAGTQEARQLVGVEAGEIGHRASGPVVGLRASGAGWR